MYKKILDLFSKKKTPKQQIDSREEENFQTDQKVLDEEKNLIDFIKHNIKSSETKNEIFRVQNLLNELYGLVEPIVQTKNIEFLYDIDKNIPIELVGDTLILEQMLYNLLKHILEENQDSTLIIRFKKDNNRLIITISCQSCLDDKDGNTTFIELSKQLISKINGTLSIERDGSSLLYKIEFPLLYNDLYQENFYQLPPNITGKKVLLIEDHHLTAQIISKIFTEFELHVTIETSDTLPSLRIFDDYDIVILDEKRITPILMRHLHETKEKHNIKIISFEKLFGWHKDRRLKPSKIIDKYLYKPLSRGMVSGLLYEMFNLHTNDSITLKREKSNILHRSGKIIFLEETLDITRKSFKDFGKKHILIVEDNEINQRIMQSVLETSNINTTSAYNGYQALEYLDNDDSIDMVLMDINMPKMDGYQATKHIRKNERLKDIPIVIISGLGFRNEIEQMYFVGADAHLTKPFKVGQLYTAFKIFLHKKRERSESLSISTQYNEDKNILNTKEGIERMHNVLSYRDALREILVRLKYSDHIIKERIIKKEFKELHTYCQLLHEDTTLIEAQSLSNILHEILVLLKNNEDQLLQHYIALYGEEWLKTKRSIELYLKR
jgi:CheY-like chemotaxis protein